MGFSVNIEKYIYVHILRVQKEKSEAVNCLANIVSELLYQKYVHFMKTILNPYMAKITICY